MKKRKWCEHESGLVRRREIPCSKVGGKFLFRVQALDEYLSTKEKESVNF